MSEEHPYSRNGSVPALPRGFREHASVFSSDPNSKCWPRQLPNEPVIRHKVLAAKETSDILILDWPEISEEAPLFSLGRSLVLAGARLLELDSRELGVELKPNRNGELSILLYDTSPGGAGHCLELLDLSRAWFESAQTILRGSPDHDAHCRRACIECLLDFGGQFKAHLLDRQGALALLDAVM